MSQSKHDPTLSLPQVLDDVVEHLPESFDLEAIRARVDEPSPYAMVAIQARQPICRMACSWTACSPLSELLC